MSELGLCFGTDLDYQCFLLLEPSHVCPSRTTPVHFDTTQLFFR